MMLRALISIHDVMPSTLFQVERIIERLPPRLATPVVLLVIPGHSWTSFQIARLRAWQQAGCILAGHGWQHRTNTVQSRYHRLHSRLISRNVAEHLSISEAAVKTLLDRNFAWFKTHGLTPPDYYVPPAWAMGNVNKNTLRASPFRYYETTSGIYDSHRDSRRILPLIGFEADTPMRKWLLAGSNRVNKLLASGGRPLRMALHPRDYQLLLGDSIDACFSEIAEAIHYHDAFV